MGDTLGSESEQMQQLTVGGLDLARLSGPISNYNPEFKAFRHYIYMIQRTICGTF